MRNVMNFKMKTYIREEVIFYLLQSIFYIIFIYMMYIIKTNAKNLSNYI